MAATKYTIYNESKQIMSQTKQTALHVKQSMPRIL